MVVTDNIRYVTNHRLKGAMLNAEISAQQLAHLVDVDAKSVARWIHEDRIPHPPTRSRVARVLDHQESFLWPELVLDGDADSVARAELERLWPSRSAVSSETWHSLFNRAAEAIDILVYAGGFLIEALDLADIVRWKAGSGARIRIAIGDPGSDAVRVRSEEEGLPWLADRCRTTANYLTEIRCCSGLTVRAHGTTLYASMFRFDNTVLVNAHTFGAWACQSPVTQIRRVQSGSLFDYYSAAFERVWRAGREA